MKRQRIFRDTLFGQWKGCVFVQIGTTAVVLYDGLSRDRSWGLELVTPWRWFALRPFHRLTWHRVA